MVGHSFVSRAWNFSLAFHRVGYFSLLRHIPKTFQTSSDCFLFWSFQNYLNEKIPVSIEDCKRYQKQLFAEKDKKVLDDRIRKLPKRW